MTMSLSQAGLDEILTAADAPLTAAEFRQRILARIGNGVEQAGDAYAFSPHSDGFTYGVNRWRFVLAEVGLGFDDIDDVQVLNSGGMRVTILPIGDGRTALIYPLCFANDAHTSAQGVRINPSRLRKLLFATPGTSRRGLQLMLPGSIAWEPDVVDEGQNPEIAGENAAAAEVEAAIAEMPELPRTIIVGYASNPNGGLLQLIIGEATMAGDGTLSFGWLEQVDLAGVGPSLHLVSASDEASFAEEPEPEYDVVPREGDEASGTDSDG
jgi:hypothetical protein